MEKAAKDLEQATHKLAEVMYRQGQSQPSDAAAGASGPGAEAGGRRGQAGGGGAGDEVIDAEYVDADEKR
jgi:hypothetical protein